MDGTDTSTQPLLPGIPQLPEQLSILDLFLRNPDGLNHFRSVGGSKPPEGRKRGLVGSAD